MIFTQQRVASQGAQARRGLAHSNAVPSRVARPTGASVAKPLAGAPMHTAGCSCQACGKRGAAVTAHAAATEAVTFTTENRDEYFTRRHEIVLEQFPTALGLEDFVSRVEVALWQHGFKGTNSIACTNLCRDEITGVLKTKIEEVFGSSFNTNGLGGVLTCGLTGMGAGLSHSPLCIEDGRERYVFFAFPHIAIDESGDLGAISRPNRPGNSCACGAMAACLGQLKAEGLDANCRAPGVHDPLDPELSILKQRLARRIRSEGLEPADMTLTDITAVGERMISDDLETLISKAVDLDKADYAVITGVQIHNWSKDLAGDNFEFVAPTKAYVVVRGEQTIIDLAALPPVTPRQLVALNEEEGREAGISAAGSTLQSMNVEYLTKIICSSTIPEKRSYTLKHKPLRPAYAELPAAEEVATEVEVAEVVSA